MPQHGAIEQKLPMVTAVIPTHNHKEWVFDAINSIVDQDYPRKQIVVVDDGSRDGFAVMEQMDQVKVLENDKAFYHRIGVVSGTDVRLMLLGFTNLARGPSFARNVGIKAAWPFTDVYAFLDSDDIYAPRKISKSIDLWLTAPDLIGVVYSDYETWNPTTDLKIREYKEPFGRERLLAECLVNCDSLVAKKVFERVGLFDEDLRVCEDYDFWLRASEHFMLCHIAESLVTIRVGNHSSTSTVKNELWRSCYQKVMAKAQWRANNPS